MTASDRDLTEELPQELPQKLPQDLSYEQALELFDGKLRSLEEGNLTLEEAIKAVEEGRNYLKVCEARLDAARQKIEVRPQAPAIPAVPEAEEELPPLEDRLL